jgi:hypothetical protein
MSATATLNGFGVFSDEVYTSTDLNRRAGEVLNHAREHPVTISRNNEQFALLKREQAARLVRLVDRTSAILTLLSEVHAVIHGDNPSPPFAWLIIFEKDDLQKLCSEVLGAVGKAAGGIRDWDEVAGVIHEWRESAIVAKSGVLDHAMFHEEADEVPLPDPREISDSKDSESATCLIKG